MSASSLLTGTGRRSRHLRHRPGLRGPCRRLAHQAVDPGLPHVQALHRVQAGTPQRLTPVIPDGPLPVDVAPGSECRWRCLQGPNCWPSGGSDPRWPPARRGYGTVGKPLENRWKTAGKLLAKPLGEPLENRWKTAGKLPGNWQNPGDRQNCRENAGKAPFLGDFCQSQ